MLCSVVMCYLELLYMLCSIVTCAHCYVVEFFAAVLYVVMYSGMLCTVVTCCALLLHIT